MADDPIPYEQVPARVARRDRLVEVPDRAVAQSVLLSSADPDLVRTSVTPVETPNTAGGRTVRLDIEVARPVIGAHAFPDAMVGVQLPRDRDLFSEESHPELATGFLPDHLPLAPVPARLERRFRIPRTLDYRYRAGQRYATAVFPPDNRYTFSDLAFPWCTGGKVGPTGASGVMVGPRHVLTVSHGIRWINPPNPHVADWVSFTPGSFDGSQPFGVAFGTHVYWQQQVAGPTIEGTEDQYDYALVVLDRPIGELTGWMGSRSYTDSWDGGSYWSHIGYPGDLAGGQRPSFQGGIALNGDDTQPDEHQTMRHMGDVWPGQSGGPYFGWWGDEPWPRVVAVQSWELYADAARTIPSINGASGGASMVDLIIRARNEHP